MVQPGERWLYNTGSDALGVLIARVSGQSFEAFLRERIFGPLDMKNTAFSVPAEKLDRLPGCYSGNSRTGALDIYDDARESQWARAPAFPSGAGGLVSTVDDYLAFCRMMLNKGRYEHGRILSRLEHSVPGPEHPVEHKTCSETGEMGLGQGEPVLPLAETV